MAFAALAAEVRLQDRLSNLDTTASFLAALDGQISGSRLSQALRGIKNLQNEDAVRLLNLTARLVALREAFSPVPLALTNPTDVRYLLDNLAATDDAIREKVSELFQKEK